MSNKRKNKRLVSPKQSNRIDAQIGSQVRYLRESRNFTQTALAKALGLTYQQIAKYERGADRMGASRLQQIADALNVPVSAFFEGVAQPAFEPVTDLAGDFLRLPEALRLATAFKRIPDGRVRRKIVSLVASLVE